MSIISIMIQKIAAEKTLGRMSENDPFRSAYETTIRDMQLEIERLERWDANRGL
jgi:hypothetical protein